ncbi:MAG: hypothetical protein AAB776_03130 [Patescibacteria group bacterium]
METSHKLHVWIILLLVWNAALLMLIIGFLYFRPTPPPDASTVAAECSAATLATLKDTCISL